jgi:hypothetical protein
MTIWKRFWKVGCTDRSRYERLRLYLLNTAAVTRIDRMITLNISSRTRRTMPVGLGHLGPTKEDNEVMGEMSKRATVNSSVRRCKPSVSWIPMFTDLLVFFCGSQPSNLKEVTPHEDML